MTCSNDRKLRITLPKVLNKQTGQESSTLFQFSSANWYRDTMAYRKLICKWGGGFVHMIFEATNAAKVEQASCEETNEPVDVNLRALLCTDWIP